MLEVDAGSRCPKSMLTMLEAMPSCRDARCREWVRYRCYEVVAVMARSGRRASHGAAAWLHVGCWCMATSGSAGTSTHLPMLLTPQHPMPLLTAKVAPLVPEEPIHLHSAQWLPRRRSPRARIRHARRFASSLVGVLAGLIESARPLALPARRLVLVRPGLHTERVESLRRSRRRAGYPRLRGRKAQRISTPCFVD